MRELSWQSKRCSSSEEGWEAGPNVAHVGRHGRSRPRLVVVCRLELRNVRLSLHLHFPRNRFLRVLLVHGEPGQGLVIATFRRIGWLEGLVVDRGGSSGCSGKTRRDSRVLLKDFTVRIESGRPLGPL